MYVLKWIYSLSNPKITHDECLSKKNIDGHKEGFIKSCERGHIDVAQWLYDLVIIMKCLLNHVQMVILK